MYDSETVRLIQGVEPLENLDLEQLPQFLTEAYAKVVAARLGVVELSEGRRDDEWTGILDELRRLADTYEGLSVFLPSDNPHRASCAFVAASAHHTLSQARVIEAQAQGHSLDAPSLTMHGVGPEVSACLLFLLADQQADAAETTKLFEESAQSPAEAALLRGLSALASGDGQQLRRLAASDLSVALDDFRGDYLERAAAVLWAKLTNAVRLIGRISLGLEVNEQPENIIESVLTTIQDSQRTVHAMEQHLTVRPTLAGPYHLARLLRSVSSRLLDCAVVATTAPSNVDEQEWQDFIRQFASRRPFMWRNHVDALAEGFLGQGRSFVLTFPTGAGKTTLTELKIATELLRGRKVVYLAPTRALVDQVSKELSEQLASIGESVVRGRFLEDFGEDAAGRVFVQTPEQCLAYLSFDANAHHDLGLIVVDEAHQLSGEPPKQDGRTTLPGQRSVDAMWALLSLLQRSSDADVVLISAMVRNGEALAEWLSTATQRPASVLELPWKPTRQVRGVVVYESDDIRELNGILATRKQARVTQRPRKADKQGIGAQPIGLFCYTQVWATDSGFAKFPVLSGQVPLGVSDFWRVTANRNVVGGHLLGVMAQAKMRPIVFSQQVGWTKNIAKTGSGILESAGHLEVELTSEEKALFDAAAIELGDEQHVEGIIGGRIGVHHGLLLWPERAAVEAAFRRPNGLFGLVATPTVAQGINLPAEAVVIAGDDRWDEDQEEGGMKPLAVHELLNAAGRAGRAGHYAHGIVINLPGAVLTVEDRNGSYAVKGLDHIMSLLGLPDQCLDVVDPITQVMDRIQAAAVDSDISEYLVRRAAGIPEHQLARILGTTFGNAAYADREDRALAQVALLRAFGAALDDQDDDHELDLDTWRDFAGLVGVSPFVVARIAAGVPTAEKVAAWTFEDFLYFAIDEVAQHLFGLVNPVSAGFSRIMPRGTNQNREFTESIDEWEQRWRIIIPELIQAWVDSEHVAGIGQRLHAHRNATGSINPVHLGRRFALHSVTSIGHAASIVVRIVQTLHADALSDLLKEQLQLVSGCIREGFDKPDKLLLFWQLRRFGGLYPRVAVHSAFSNIQRDLPQWSRGIDVDARRQHILQAWGDR